jgi:hypothetical protein
MSADKPLGALVQLECMTHKPPPRDRTGRVAPQTFINALNRRYSVIKGRYEAIERECELVSGVAALIEAQDRVDSEKKLMRRVLDAIEVVALDIDPNWSAGRIKPTPPKEARQSYRRDHENRSGRSPKGRPGHDCQGDWPSGRGSARYGSE